MQNYDKEIDKINKDAEEYHGEKAAGIIIDLFILIALIVIICLICC